MSGKDLQTFITSFKAEDVEKLTVRMKNGLGSSKYKPAEYKRLLAIVDAKRQETELIGQKVHKTRCAAKATKESSILCQHRQVWSTECLRLQKAEEKTENEIQDFIKQIRPNNITDSGIFSLQEYELFLERERETFRINTVEPVYQLRDDLYFRLGEVQHQQLSAHPSNWEQVIQQINFVKAQQDDIITKLHAEYLDLEEEIASLGLQKYLTSTSDNLMNVPKEVLNSDCPYPELKDSLIEAFHSLSERYQSRLRSLQEQLQRTDRFCGWCQQDHERFQFTVSRYTSDIPNHRALCMDMLLRLFPEKSRQELSPPGDLTLQSVNAAADLGAVTLLSVYCRHSAVDGSTHTLEHEGVWDLQRFTQAQLRAVTQQWQRDHEGLLARAQVTLQEANNAHQEELELHRDRQHRQDICLHLREKVQQWRAQQEEVAKLEAAIAARQQEEEEARLRREREKEAAIRSQQKEKVRQFYLKQQKRREVLEQRDQERLANLRSVMEEQARRDKERVQFRANMLQQRRLEKEVRELEQQREEQERQNRLEALRNQVGVVAEADPERMMADTEAWKSRHLNVNDFELQKPLYSINTYTDTQIASDPRVRVEQALREADLHHSQYAREALSVIKPPKPPRRDTRSILKF